MPLELKEPENPPSRPERVSTRGTTIFEGDDILVSAAPANSPTLVITFNYYAGDWAGAPAYVDKFVQHYSGFAGVFFTARRRHFWQTAEISEAIESVRRFGLQDFSRRVTFGTSMGGYGALLFSGPIGATDVIAVAPQTTITEPSVLYHEKWNFPAPQEAVLWDRVDLSIPNGVTPKIIYDPWVSVDASHVEWLAQRRRVCKMVVPFAGHRPLTVLKQSGALADVTLKLLSGEMDSPDFRRAFRVARRRSEIYLKQLRYIQDMRKARSAAPTSE